MGTLGTRHYQQMELAGLEAGTDTANIVTLTGHHGGSNKLSQCHSLKMSQCHNVTESQCQVMQVK